VTDIDTDAVTRRTSSLLAASQRLLATSVEILHTRIEIVGTELEEAGAGARQLAVYALVALFFLAMGLLLATLFVVVLFWETRRLEVLGGFALLYLGAGAATALLVRRRLRNQPRLFSTTLSELDKDRERLTSRR
jgi:uncharacterized membrane protein YqjE